MRSLEFAIKYFSGESIIGTAAERAAMTTHVSLNYTAILGSPYSPEFFLKLNEGTGTAIANSGSNSGYTAAINASGTMGTWADGVTGNSKSVKFVGTSGTYGITHSTIPTESDDNFTLGITFKIPVNWTGGDSNDHHIWRRDWNGGGLWQMNMTNDGYISMGYYNSGWQHIRGSTDCMDNEWHTFFFTMDSSGTVKGYLDGVQDFTGTEDRSGYSGNDNDFIGNQGGASTDIFYIDNAFFKASTMSASDISDLHDLLVPSSTASTYPNLPNGAIFEESDTGKHYMFDGTSSWNEMT